MLAFCLLQRSCPAGAVCRLAKDVCSASSLHWTCRSIAGFAGIVNPSAKLSTSLSTSNSSRSEQDGTEKPSTSAESIHSNGQPGDSLASDPSTLPAATQHSLPRQYSQDMKDDLGPDELNSLFENLLHGGSIPSHIGRSRSDSSNVTTSAGLSRLPPLDVDGKDIEYKGELHAYDYSAAEQDDSNAEDDKENEEVEDESWKENYQAKIVDLRRTCTGTPTGGKWRFSCMVAVGNGQGVLGHGTGKSGDARDAMVKAHARALNNLVGIHRHRDHTVFHSRTVKFGKVKVIVYPRSQGSGIVASPMMREMCKLAGLHDIGIKVYGSRNARNSVKGLFLALTGIRDIRETAKEQGKYVVERAVGHRHLKF